MKARHQKGYAEGIPVGHQKGYGVASTKAQQVLAQMMAVENQLRAKHSEYEKETAYLRNQVGQYCNKINQYGIQINQYKNEITNKDGYAKQLAQHEQAIEAHLASKSGYIDTKT